MGHSRYALGDGISSISNKHLGQGIILNAIRPSKEQTSTGNIDTNATATCILPPSSLRKVDPKIHAPYSMDSPIVDLTAERVYVGYTNLCVHHVTDYHQLKEILGIDANITSAFLPIGKLSADIAFAKSVKLKLENITLIIVGERIAHEDFIPKSEHLKFNTDLSNLLNTDPITFVSGNGDHYINSIKYGEKFFAEVKILYSSNEKGEEFKQHFSAKLQSLLSPDAFRINNKTKYTRNELFERSEIDIRISLLGSPESGFPLPSMDINNFAKFLEKLNGNIQNNAANKRADYPIAYTSEPYSTALKTPGAARLEKNVETAKELLSLYEQLLNSLRLIIPPAKKMLDQANKLTQLGKNKNDLNEHPINNLLALYNEANQYQDDIQLFIIPMIIAAQTDISTLRWRIPPALNNFSQAASSNAGSRTPNIENYFDEKHVINARKKLIDTAKDFKNNIEQIERQIAEIIKSLNIEIQCIHFTNKHFTHRVLGIKALQVNWFSSPRFHIKIPTTNATLRWQIYPLDSNEPYLKNVKFNVYIEKNRIFWKFRAFTDLRHDSETPIVAIRSADRFQIRKIRTLSGEPYRRPLRIAIFLTGEQALLVRNGNSITALEQTPQEHPKVRTAISDEHRSIYIENNGSQSSPLIPSSQLPGFFRQETLPNSYGLFTRDGRIQAIHDNKKITETSLSRRRPLNGSPSISEQKEHSKKYQDENPSIYEEKEESKNSQSEIIAASNSSLNKSTDDSSITKLSDKDTAEQKRGSTSSLRN